MDHVVQTARAAWRATVRVPASKSVVQRALILSALDEAPRSASLEAALEGAGDDVRHCAAATAALGHVTGGFLGDSRASLALDAGESGTALRFLTALATLRPTGARTLIRGRPVLLRRPHRTLRLALLGLGARIKRRASGAFRVLGGALSPNAVVDLDMRRSSQYASALALIAPRVGGMTLRLRGGSTSRPYLDLTLAMLQQSGVGVNAAGDCIRIDAGAPVAGDLVFEPDASAAAAWWTAAALTGGQVTVPGLPRGSRQADMALLPLLEAMGAHVVVDASGAVAVEGPAVLRAPPQPVDLTRNSDLLFLVGVLAARAEGETVIRGVAHARAKESDRVAVLAAGLEALGVRVTVRPDDSLHILGGLGGGMRGAPVATAGDHRAAFAFGVLGLAVPGVVLRGAEVVSKSQPLFLQRLASLAREGSESAL